MVYLFWSLLNIGLFLSFLVICFKATKLLRERVGLLASLVFVLGLVSFIGVSNKSNTLKKSKENVTWESVSKESLKNSERYLYSIDLEKTLVSKYSLNIIYGLDNRVKIPVSAYSTVTGLVSGVNWNTASIVIRKTKDENIFEYHVTGIEEWRLIGTGLYFKPKEFKGLIRLK